MTAKSDAAWAKVMSDLSLEQREQLSEMRKDYNAAAKMHTAYTGGPNAGILSELIRMGWRKQ